MPLRVFGLDGEVSTEKIIEAMDYAINNGANIINLSLGQTQFKYSNLYDEVIKRAFDSNIIVIIAAGNGDALSLNKSGVDLTKNPIAPVCNNGGENENFSIGVYSSNTEGYRTNWTNYGDCTDFMAPGENIVSTSVPLHNSKYGSNYNINSGTSFSAPIISGVVALGFNQYGEVPFDIVFQSLNDSLVENTVGNKVIDASVYIEKLGKNILTEREKNKIEQEKQDVGKPIETKIEIVRKEVIEKEKSLKDMYKKEFSSKFGTKLSLFPVKTLNSLNKQIDLYLKRDLDLDLIAKLEALRELINEELKR